MDIDDQHTNSQCTRAVRRTKFFVVGSVVEHSDVRFI